MKAAVFILAALWCPAPELHATQRGEHRISGDKKMEFAYLDARHALMRENAPADEYKDAATRDYIVFVDRDFFSICEAKYSGPPEVAEFTGDIPGNTIVHHITELRLLRHVIIGIGLDPAEDGPLQQTRYFICDLKAGRASFFKSKEACAQALAKRWGVKEYPAPLPPGTVMQSLEQTFDDGLIPPKPTGHLVTKKKIETREQLLTAVNTWMKKHHQRELTLDELIVRTVEEADALRLYGNSPIGSLLVNLIKGEPFTHEVQLRTIWRNEIPLRTTRRAIPSQRMQWDKVLNKQMPWTDIKLTETHSRRRLPLPAHYTLSLNMMANPAEIRAWKADQKQSTYWGILLASALVEQKQPTRAWPEGQDAVPQRVATPKELLGAINVWKHSWHEPATNLNEVTIGVADQIFALREAKKVPEPEIELFLECLAKDMRFIFPLRIDTKSPSDPEKPDDARVVSAGEELPLPPNSKISIEISKFPWEALPDDPLVKFLKGLHLNEKVSLSYAFPAKEDKAEATRAAQPVMRE